MKSVIDKANLVLSRIKPYLEANYLHINIKKSNFMHFTSPRSKSNLADYVHYSDTDDKITFGNESITFGSKTLKRVKIIDEKLSLNSQIRHIGKKVTSIIGSLYEMRRIITKNLRSLVYNALVNSHLSYGISVWGSSASQPKLNNLFVLQKKPLETFSASKKNLKMLKDIPNRLLMITKY